VHGQVNIHAEVKNLKQQVADLSSKITELELLNPALEQLQKKFITLSIQVKLAAKP
jgi:hypothetical protein